MISGWPGRLLRASMVWLSSRVLWVCGERDLAVSAAERLVRITGLPGDYLDLVRMLRVLGRDVEADRWVREFVSRYPRWSRVVARTEIRRLGPVRPPGS